MWLVFTSRTSMVRGGFYEATTQHIETLPIPDATDAQKQTIADLAQTCQQTAEEICRLTRKFLSLLCAEFTLDRPNTKLQKWHDLNFTQFLGELTKHKITPTLTQKSEWMDLFDTQRAKIKTLQTSLIQAERDINHHVYTLYNLTPDEITLIESLHA